jgi:hypothetical protein
VAGLLGSRDFRDRACHTPLETQELAEDEKARLTRSVKLRACALAIRDPLVPPTVNLDDPERDYVPHLARKKKRRSITRLDSAGRMPRWLSCGVTVLLYDSCKY